MCYQHQDILNVIIYQEYSKQRIKTDDFTKFNLQQNKKISFLDNRKSSSANVLGGF